MMKKTNYLHMGKKYEFPMISVIGIRAQAALLASQSDNNASFEDFTPDNDNGFDSIFGL